MLHEVLLALAGHPSPLLDESKSNAITKFLSPSERSLLRGLACLGSLQTKIRDHCTKTSSSHGSVICRAICASIVSSHLSRFDAKVVDVEAAILRSDAKYVGAYDIVPLSAIVAAFDGWDRVLRWLDQLVSRIAGNEAAGSFSGRQALTSGALLNDYLKDEVHTGYPEIEEIASQLLQVAQATWVRQLTPWIMYGRLPSYGIQDFFIQHHEASQSQSITGGFFLDRPLAPSYVDTDTALSIMFIGRSLQHIQRGHAKLDAKARAELETARAKVLRENLSLLQSLELPLTTFTLRRIVNKMRLSLSRNALQKLLPFSEITRLLDVLRQFFLLERGEFALALIGAADECLAGRHLKTGNHKDRARLGGMMIKDGEVSSVLSRTWTSLVALQDVNDDDDDEDLEYAREIVDLSIRKQAEDAKVTPAVTPASRLESTASLFDDVLLATPTVLTIRLESPLDIFLSEQDVQDYSLVHAYLLAIRRAHLHLAELWRQSTLRRSHPSPRPHSLASGAAEMLRLKADVRVKRMRSVWAAVAHARFFFAQLNDYLQGEVVEGCTGALQDWIHADSKKEPTSGRLVATHDRPSGANDVHTLSPDNHESRTNAVAHLSLNNQTEARHDLEALASTHHIYLSSLKDSLLLNEPRLITSLRNLMTRIDHVVALTQRLAAVTQITQLAEQTAASDLPSTHAREESDLMKSLDSVRKSINANLDELLKGLRDLDDRKRMGMLPSQRAAELQGKVGGGATGGEDAFVPWHGPGLSRLLLRLESGTGNDVFMEHSLAR